MGKQKCWNCNEIISRYELLQELHRRDQDSEDIIETVNDMTPKGIDFPDQSNNIVVFVDITPMNGNGVPMALNDTRFLATLSPTNCDRLGITADYVVDVGEKHVVLHKDGNRLVDVTMSNRDPDEGKEKCDEALKDLKELIIKSRSWWGINPTMPKDDMEYYFLTDCNTVKKDVWSSNNTQYSIHMARFKAHNCFKYKKHCVFEANCRNVYNRLMDFAKPFVKDPFDPTLSYFIIYDFIEHRITVSCTSVRNLLGDVYFESEATAVKALNDIGAVDFLKYYLGVPAIEITKNRARIDASVKELNERYGNR